MRFHITMNMPSRGGNQVHQIVAETNISNLDEFSRFIEDKDFITVMEIYRDNDGKLFPKRKVIINTQWIGKISEAEDAVDKQS